MQNIISYIHYVYIVRGPAILKCKINFYPTQLLPNK